MTGRAARQRAGGQGLPDRSHRDHPHRAPASPPLGSGTGPRSHCRRWTAPLRRARPSSSGPSVASPPPTRPWPVSRPARHHVWTFSHLPGVDVVIAAQPDDCAQAMFTFIATGEPPGHHDHHHDHHHDDPATYDDHQTYHDDDHHRRRRRRRRPRRPPVDRGRRRVIGSVDRGGHPHRPVEANLMISRGCSSAGRALRSQCRGRGFESLHLHWVERITTFSLLKVYFAFRSLTDPTSSTPTILWWRIKISHQYSRTALGPGHRPASRRGQVGRPAFTADRTKAQNNNGISFLVERLYSG